MGIGQGTVSDYVRMVKRNEQYSAEVRYAQYKKAALKEASFVDKVKFYFAKKDKFIIKAYNPITGEKFLFDMKERTQDLAIIKFHKYYKYWVIRKIENKEEILYEEATL